VALLVVGGIVTYRLIQRSKQVFPGSEDYQAFERGIRVGDMTVSGHAFREDEVVGLSIKLRTDSTKKKFEFARWSKDTRGISLVDDLGNSYKPVPLPAALRVHLGEGDTIRQDRTVEDMLLFESPVADAKWLLFSLPAAAIEGSGSIKIRI